MSAEVVAGIKVDLEIRGVNFLGACGAFAITGRVAWALRDQGFGLVHKNEGQNGCTVNGARYAVDAVMLRDGSCFDILINSETENRPAWQPTGPQPPQMWRAPIDLDAGTVQPPTEPPVEPPVVIPPVPPVETQALAEALMSVAENLEVLTAEISDLRDDLRTHADVKGLDVTVVVDGLAHMEAQIQKGLTGTVFGARVTLKPPP